MLDDVVGSPADEHDEDIVGTVMLAPDEDETETETDGDRDPTRAGADPNEASLQPGDCVSRYQLIERLGAGGMGVVWVARDPELDRTVAVKVLHEQRRRHAAAQASERLRREALALARLSHPNVVRIYDVGVHEQRVFLTMEHIEGHTLDVWAAQRPELAQVLEVFEQAAAGLAAVHEAGFVHRDFKPANVMIDRDGRVLVMDFGLARIHDPESVSQHDSTASSSAWPIDASRSFSSALTVDGVVMGTPAYMAPEQHTGDEADARADQFAFCATLFEVLLGRRPFSGRSVVELARDKSEGTLDFEGALPLPRAIRALLRRGLDPEPSRRHADMHGLQAALGRLRRPHRRRGVVAMGLGVVVLGGAGWLASSWSSAEPCEAGSTYMAETWSDEARAGLSSAFAATGLAYADDAAQRTSGRLDAYAADWVESYARVCHVGRDDAALFDLRMRCLGDARASMKATVGVLLKADAATVQRAVTQVADLPALRRCDDVEALRAQVVAPADPAAVAALDALRQQLEEAAALDRAGHYAEGHDEAERVLEQALELGYAPMIARARIRLASLDLALGDPEAARQGLVDAELLASGSGDHQAAADAATRLAFVLAENLDEPDEAERWARHATASLDRLPPDPLARARLASNFGVIHARRAEHPQALEAFERAYAAKRELLGEDHPEVTGALENVALSHGEVGDLEEAERLQRRALEQLEGAVGPRHPDVGLSLMNLAFALERLGRLDESAAHYERALGILRESLGSQHPRVAGTLGALGHLAVTQDRLGEAEAYFRESSEIFEVGELRREQGWSLADRGLVTAQLGREEDAVVIYARAREVLEAAAGPDHESLAYVMMDEARVLIDLGRVDDAASLVARAGEILEPRLAPEDPSWADLWVCQAELLRGQGRLEDARRKLSAALERGIAALGPEHVQIGFDLLELGEVEHALQQDEAAREHLRRALVLAERPEAGEGFRAATRFALAQALWPEAPLRAEAQALARAAHEGFIRQGEGFEDDVEEVGTWLREHSH